MNEVRKLRRQTSVRQAMHAEEGVGGELLLADRKAALCGQFSTTFHSENVWSPQSFKMKVFFSSTFTDTYQERDILMNEVLPRLRERVHAQNVEVTFVDMRWGIRDENTLDHRTWIECKREIVRCYDDSWGVFFVSLQSQKYGYTPLPRTIDAAAFDERLKERCTEEEAVALALEWYYLDENAVPKERVLHNLTRMDDDSYWKVALPKLLVLFDGLPFDDSLVVGSSVTEWEVRTALELEKDNTKIFWMHREFAGGVTTQHERHWDFNDTLNDECKAARFQRLVDFMHRRFPPDSVGKYTSASLDSYRHRDDVWVAQQKLWAEDMYERLSASLDDVIRVREDWVHNACGLGIAGDEATEMLHHAAFAARKVADFVGREALVQEAMEHILSVSASTDRTSTAFTGIALSVIGKSGSGKTALMAKLADSIANAQRHTPRDDTSFAASQSVIIRFCGTSPGSSTGLALVRSICRQIHLVLRHNLPDSTDVLSMDYKAVVTHLHQLLHDHPVVLMIDSLDQLSNADLARSDISFLKGVQPHPQTRIIVSVLPDEIRETGAGNKDYSYFYGCETKLRQCDVPRVVVPVLGSQPQLVSNDSVESSSQMDDSQSEARYMMSAILSRKARRLTEQQWEYAMSKVAEEPTALYLQLAVRVVEKWTSETKDDMMKLNSGVKALIGQIFDTLERDYGRELTRAALGFLTFAVEGVTDEEMCDLLSLHKGVMTSVNQFHQSTRLPMHVWLRLRGDLVGLISERAGGCLQFYHRQLWETSRERYGDEERCVLLKTMAVYFGDLVSSEVRTDKGIAAQPLLRGRDTSQIWFLESRPHVNRRRVVETAAHMLKEGVSMVDEAIQELCSLEAVCARSLCGECFTLVEQLGRLESLNNSNKRLHHYSRWVRRDVHYIAKSPTFVLGRATSQPAESNVSTDALAVFHHQAHMKKCQLDETNSFLRFKVLGTCSGFDPCFSILEGHMDSVQSVSFSPDGSCIASGSNDNTVRLWDAATGAQLQVLEGHTGAVESVSFSPDGSRIASGSDDKTVRVWDAATGSELQVLDGHTYPVLSVSFSPDGSCIASGSDDRTVRVWDAIAGAQLQVLEGHTAMVYSVGFSPKWSRIVSGSADKTVRLWDAATGAQLQVLEGHIDFVQSVCFSPDGSRIASVSGDKTVRLWDAMTGAQLQVLEGHTDYAKSVCFSPDGSRIASGSADKTVRLWDAVTGAQLYVLNHMDWVLSVSVSPCGSHIVTGSGNAVLLWDAVRFSNDTS